MKSNTSGICMNVHENDSNSAERTTHTSYNKVLTLPSRAGLEFGGGDGCVVAIWHERM
jgi:hypothetical protein